MSRIGKKPIIIPSSVTVSVDENGVITAKNSKETKTLETFCRVGLNIEANQLILSLVGEDKQSKAFWGTYRALANNMITGLDKPFERKLEINGVGYRAAVNGKNLEMQLGFSHPIVYPIPDGLEISVEKNTVLIKGSDKQQVGQVAAEIREFRPPEPYKGKGVKYSDEVIRRKAGKTSKK